MSNIRAVAELAGVSVATVSRALQQPDLVSAKTRTKVLAAVEEVGYKPNLMAVKFRSGKGSRTLIALCRDYGVELLDAHNSTADAVAAGRLAQRQASKFPQLNVSADELHGSQAAWSDEQSLEFEAWLKQQDRPDYRAVLGWPIKN